MVTYEQAIENVRKEFKNWMIRVGFDLPNEYLFTVSPGSTYSIDDTTACYAIVDKNTGAVRSESCVGYNSRIADIREVDRISKLMDKTRRPVDLTKKQWAEYVQWCDASSGPDISKLSDAEIEAINATRRKYIEQNKK